MTKYTIEQIEDAAGNNVDKYRFSMGSLFEFDVSSNAYIHCFKQVGVRTTKAAIEAYEDELYANDSDEFL